MIAQPKGILTLDLKRRRDEILVHEMLFYYDYSRYLRFSDIRICQKIKLLL